MKKLLLATLAAVALAVGVSLPSHAATICVEAKVVVAGTTVIDQPQTCQEVAPPAAP